MTLTSATSAFFLGMWEFRSMWTTHFDPDAQPQQAEAYEWGREIAHASPSTSSIRSTQ